MAKKKPQESAAVESSAATGDPTIAAAVAAAMGAAAGTATRKPGEIAITLNPALLATAGKRRKRRVIIEVTGAGTIAAKMMAAAGMEAVGAAGSPLKGINLDPTFSPVPVPVHVPSDVPPAAGIMGVFATAEATLSSNYIVRAEVSDDEHAQLAARPNLRVYADPPIQPIITCGGTPPVGTDKSVEQLLCVDRLRQQEMDGRGVLVAIVDTGINMAHLNGKGKNPALDAVRSWSPAPGGTPGAWPVNHGTMCAFDVCIAAPNCTLLDIAVLQSKTPGGSTMDGLLSDAVRAYSHLLGVMRAPRPTGEVRALVVNNSWGMFDPSWDFPIGDPGNYSDNPNHPFNRIVATLEKAGADVLFAAGNCGRECPDQRCGGNTTNAIYGANSHASVLCVAGVDVNGDRVGYSTIGPGRLSKMKPDIASYTHFAGSGVYPADSGTSAATPVAAGVIAALRTRKPYDPGAPTTFPAAMRQALIKAAIDKSTVGYDFEYGWGIINPCEMISSDGAPTLAGGAAAPVPVAAEALCDLAIRPSPNAAPGSALQTFFGRISPDASPGVNVLTINGLPAGTRVISVWITEWAQPDNPHAGTAVFETQSVQLYENGTLCRVRFTCDFSRHLPAAAQVIYGAG